MSTLLDPAVMRAVADILERHHRAAASAIYGRDALSPADWDLAVDLGLVDATASPETLNSQVYRMAVILAHMDQAERQSRYGDTATTWLAEVKRNPVPMTTTEVRAAKYANRKAAQYVSGLGSRAAASVNSILINEDARLSHKFRTSIRDAVAANFGDSDAQQRMEDRGIKDGKPEDFYDNAFRGTVNRLRSDIGHASGQWRRDLDRIARTEVTEAWNQGQADEWDRMAVDQATENKAPPIETRVYRVPSPTACPACLRLYTEGGFPRVFHLSALQANGTNYKVKRAEWKPVVGATHPFCVCDIQRLPPYVKLPASWNSGAAAPTVIGSDGLLVLPEPGDDNAL